ncbi:MAG: hypothetical protein ACTHMD_17595 [Flavisolibacter sp.]
MKTFLIGCIFLFGFTTGKLPEGWTKVDNPKIAGKKFEVYFFDYMTRLQKLRPDIMQLKGREFTNALRDIQFQYPVYVAQTKADNKDSVIFYILRPNKAKIDRPFYYDLQVVKVNKDFSLEALENKDEYQKHIIKTIDASKCRGALVGEHNLLVQRNPNKKEMIGNGIQIADSIYTRVIPYEEVKSQYYKVIEDNL